MRTLPIDTASLAPRDASLATAVAEVAAVVALLGLLAAAVYAPLLATLLVGGLVGAAVATVLPRARLRKTPPTSTLDASTSRCCPAD